MRNGVVCRQRREEGRVALACVVCCLISPYPKLTFIALPVVYTTTRHYGGPENRPDHPHSPYIDDALNPLHYNSHTMLLV